ncbi:hypothetical protein EIM50_16735, partial [Pseudoxanthomonas sp. SGD-10]
MLSGTIKTFNKLNSIIFILFILLSVLSCKDNAKKQSYTTLLPESGTTLKLGQDLKLSVIVSDGLPDSVHYFVDDVLVASKPDTSSVTVSTIEMSVGKRLLVAK